MARTARMATGSSSEQKCVMWNDNRVRIVCANMYPLFE